MTIISTYLGKCPYCESLSVATGISSSSSFCMSPEDEVGDPWLVQCGICQALVWHDEIEPIDKDDSDSDNWWVEASIKEYKQVLENNHVGIRKLSDKQKHHLKELVVSREKWQRKDILDDQA